MANAKQKNFFSVFKLPSELNNRVFLGFLLINLSVILVAGLSYQQISYLIKNNKISYQSLRTTQNYFQKLRNDINETNILLQTQMIVQNTQLESQRQKIWQNIIQIDDTLSKYQLTWQNTAMRLKYANLKIESKKLEKSQAELMELLAVEILPDNEKVVDKNQKINTKIFFQKKIVEINQTITQQLDAINEYLMEEFKERNTENQLALSYFWTFEIILILFLIAEIAYLGWWLARRYRKQTFQIEDYIDTLANGNIPEIEQKDNEIQRIITSINNLAQQLQKIKDFAGTVGSGTFDKEVNVFNKEGELGKALAQMQEGLTQIAIRDKQRNWVNEGIALFGNVLREYTNAQALYDDIIINLVKYVHANQGSIFVLKEGLEEKDAVLEQKSLYAYDRQRMSNKIIKRGQGLLGQAWLEKDVIYLEEAGDKFVQITSGLGGSQPRSILIVPMINTESKVLGVVELASFQKFEEFEIDFVKRVCEMMVSAISALQNNDKTRRLLEEAQRNSQRANIQEQETRQNQQRLNNAQEEIANLRHELESKKISLDRTLAYLELNLRDEIIFANSYFLDTLRYDLKDIQGQVLTTLFKNKAEINNEYQKCWQGLRNGDNEDYVLHLATKNGDDVWLDSTLTPVIDDREIVQKIIVLGIETTEKRIIIKEKENEWNAISKGVAIAEISLNGVFLYANEVFLRNTGYKLDEIVGQSYNRFLPEQNTEKSEQEQKFWQKLAFGEVVNREITLIARNSNNIVGHATFSPVPNLNGKPKKVLLIWKV
jgi:PAS domain S-box-containing protein